jgi:1-acyl-sn-glycerol-3-phosphate acyltransferase
MSFLRSCLFNLWFYLGTTIAAVMTGFGILGRRAGLLRRGWAFRFVHVWSSMMLWGLRVFAGATWEVRGRENLPKDGAALIVSMHQSAFDTIVWFVLMPQATYVMKRELLRIPFIGWMLVELGLIPVDREAGAAAIRALLKETDRAVAERRQIVIFPEGTRVVPGARAPLHPGFAAMASRSGLPIIPVTTDSGHCWGRRAFHKCPGVIHIDVHPPMPAGLSRPEMSARLDALFAAAARAQGGG